MWALRPFLCKKIRQQYVFSSSFFIHSFIHLKEKAMGKWTAVPVQHFWIAQTTQCFLLHSHSPICTTALAFICWCATDVFFFFFFFVEVNTVAGERNKCLSQHSPFMWLLPSSAQLSDFIVSPQSSSCPGLAGRCQLILDAILHSVGFCFGAQMVNLLLKQPE